MAAPVVVKMGSPDQQHRPHLGTGWTCKFSAPTSDLLNQRLRVGPYYSVVTSYRPQVLRAVHSFPRAAIKDCHKLGGLKQQIYSLTVQEARSPKPRCKHSWFLLEELALWGRNWCMAPGCWRLPAIPGPPWLAVTSLQSLPLFSPGCFSLYVLSSSYKHTRHWLEGPP